MVSSAEWKNYFKQKKSLKKFEMKLMEMKTKFVEVNAAREIESYVKSQV